MTDKQSTVVVSRELLERLASDCMESDFNEHWDSFIELRALLAAAPEQSEQPLQIPDECPHMIVFDDADRDPIMFAGTGSRAAALQKWELISNSWNAHLFVRVARNSRDDRCPSASVAPGPEKPLDMVEPVAVPVAWMRFGDDQRAIFTRSKRSGKSEPLYAHPTAYRRAAPPAKVVRLERVKGEALSCIGFNGCLDAVAKINSQE